jgi:hypothetical protein
MRPTGGKRFEMPDQNQIKHEKYTAEKIVELCGEDAHFDRFGDPNQNEPDIIFTGSHILGIEVTTAYYQVRDFDLAAHLLNWDKSVGN